MPWLRAVIVLAAILAVVRLYFVSLFESWSFDYRIFTGVGRDVWAGLDPYDAARYWQHPILHPPSTFPFFATLAILPDHIGSWTWGAINTALTLLIVPLSYRAVRRQSGDDELAEIPALELGALASVFALSDACTSGLNLGQLAPFATTLILLALWCRGRRPILAGVLLAVATMKIGTMLPFLLLFLRKEDRATWVAMAAMIIALCLANGHPERLIGQCQAMLKYIGELSQPGRANDLTFSGPQNSWIMGFDHTLYRVGFRDPRILSGGQAVILLSIGGWLAWRIRSRSLSGAAEIALVSLFSPLFLYHRLYDAIMFAPALVVAFGWARSTRGRVRYLSIFAMLLMLSILYMRVRPLDALTRMSMGWGTRGRLIQGLILPYATWSTLLAMLLLRLADRDFDTPRRSPGHSTDGPGT